jgi:hypothetical protein
MADEKQFEQLLSEFRRAGIDPDTFSAMLAVNPDEAIRALKSLPDSAGPAAFLTELRRIGVQPPTMNERPLRSELDEGRATGAA